MEIKMYGVCSVTGAQSVSRIRIIIILVLPVLVWAIGGPAAVGLLAGLIGH